MSPGHFCPAGSAHATSPFRQLPAAAFHAAAYASGNCCFAAPPGAAPDLSIGTTEVLVSAQDFVPGPKISTLAEKAVVFPLPLLASPGLPGWLPTGGRRLADGQQ